MHLWGRWERVLWYVCACVCGHMNVCGESSVCVSGGVRMYVRTFVQKV